jgi:hypothetical protein
MGSKQIEEVLSLCILAGPVERAGNGQGIRCTNPLRKEDECQPSWSPGKYCVSTVFSEYLRMSSDDVTIEPKKMMQCPYRDFNKFRFSL